MQYCPEFDIMLLDMYEMNENRILIGEYQMANKRKLNKEERKRRRLQKGKQWLLTYQGTPKHMVKHGKVPCGFYDSSKGFTGTGC